MRSPLLAVKHLEAWYGESHVLHGVDLDVFEGEVVTLLGRNGAGRTSTLRAMMGLTGRRTGSVTISGKETISLAPHQIARLGIGFCPEERGIFSTLTTGENLLLPPRVSPDGGMTMDEIFTMFPNLKERLSSPGTKLSGGEQQMLAVARILRTGAKLLLLDEISEGLAPVIVQTLARIIRDLKTRGFTIVLVEQNFRFSAELADRFYVMDGGKVVHHVRQDELHAQSDRLRAFLGV
jgi:branched-chain amino acid transport system ATP-binding protein